MEVREKVLIEDLPEWLEAHGLALAEEQSEEYQGEYPPIALYVKKEEDHEDSTDQNL